MVRLFISIAVTSMNLVAFHWWDESDVNFHTAVTDNPSEFGRSLRMNPDVKLIETADIQDMIDDHFARKFE